MVHFPSLSDGLVPIRVQTHANNEHSRLFPDISCLSEHLSVRGVVRALTVPITTTEAIPRAYFGQTLASVRG